VLTGDDLTQPLRAALAGLDSSWQYQPSILRRRLEEALAHDARPNRARIHQLVVAAEEKVPGRLAQQGGGPAQRLELASVLAATRGWTLDAAEWAVRTWALTLGLMVEDPEPFVGEIAPTELPEETGL